MTKPDRTKAPDTAEIDDFGVVPIRHDFLVNGIEVLTLQGGSQEVTKMDVYFPAGLVQAGKPLLASTVVNLISEGTIHRSSGQISELLDFHGAHLSQYSSFHYSSLTLVTLTRCFEQMVELLADMIHHPVFPEKELEIYLSKKKQEFLLDSEKVKTLAARKFNQSLFGEDHPYGMVSRLEFFDKITRNELVEFHRTCYTAKEMQIVVSGQPPANYLSLLNTLFGSKEWISPTKLSDKVPEVVCSKGQYHLVEKKGALQAAIRMGRVLFPRTHPDFMGLQVVNTLLGGYFGSRLMKTIREEKGYTYGISSYIVPLKQSGFWTISTEAGNEVRENVIEEVWNEMRILRETQVEEEELSLVKNYMLGEMIRNFDGPFATSENIKELIENELNMSFYNNFVQTIRTITPEMVQQLAKQYLRPEDFNIVVAG